MIEPICAQSNKTLKDVQTFSRGKRMDQTTAEIFGSYDEKEGLAGRNKKIIPIYIYMDMVCFRGRYSWKVLQGQYFIFSLITTFQCSRQHLPLVLVPAVGPKLAKSPCMRKDCSCPQRVMLSCKCYASICSLFIYIYNISIYIYNIYISIIYLCVCL